MTMSTPFPKEEFKARIAFEVADKQLPSISYSLVDRDTTLASGYIQRDDLSHEFTDKTTFRIASQSKMFTAICLMQLAERGLVDIDADVSTYIPGFAPENPFAGKNDHPDSDWVTLRKLMSHTAGMIREPQSGHYLDDSLPSLEKMISELGHSILKLDPSKSVFSYSNAGIDIVGRVIELVSGQSFPDYLNANVLIPIGMNDTEIISTPTILENLAPANMWNLHGDLAAPVFDLPGPAGNIYSTMPDMERFMTCLLRGGFSPQGKSIISPKSLNLMWTVIGHRRNGVGYGLNFSISDLDGWVSVGHGGAIYGFASQFILLPNAGLGAHVISTLDATNSISVHLADTGLRYALAARNTGAAPALRHRYSEISATQFKSFPGVYENLQSGELVQVVKHGRNLYLLGDGMPLQIKPKSETEFGIDGRLYSEGSLYDHLNLEFPDTDKMVWKKQEWRKTDPVEDSIIDPSIAPHLGEYGPDFNVTTLSVENGKLTCLIEFFYAHVCEPIGENQYKMQGTLYPDEALELGAIGDCGKSGIRIGPMFLARRN